MPHRASETCSESPFEIGLGARQALSRPGDGVVLGCHRGTAWLRVPGGVVGLAEAGRAPRGPLWVRGVFPWDGVAAGDTATVAAGGVHIGGVVLPLGAAPVWTGALPDPALLDGPAVDLAAGVLSSIGPSAVVEEPYAAAAAEAASAVAAGDLDRVAALLAGLGPGLTPAGDDVLGGILFGLRARLGPGAEPGLLAVADGVATTDLSLAFLHWAARGQHVEAVHDLLEAAARGDAGGAKKAAARLGRFGSSSGADVAHGLRLALGEPACVFESRVGGERWSWRPTRDSETR